MQFCLKLFDCWLCIFTEVLWWGENNIIASATQCYIVSLTGAVNVGKCCLKCVLWQCLEIVLKWSRFLFEEYCQRFKMCWKWLKMYSVCLKIYWKSCSMQHSLWGADFYWSFVIPIIPVPVPVPDSIFSICPIKAACGMLTNVTSFVKTGSSTGPDDILELQVVKQSTCAQICKFTCCFMLPVIH